MIPIKILCGCGQKYAFDVEPSGGGVGCVVQCPACGADGSEAANQVIAEHTATRPAGLQVRRHPAAAATQRPNVDPPLAPPLASYAAPARARKRWIMPAIIGCGVLAVVLVLAGLMASRAYGKKQSTPLPASSSQPDLPRTLAELNAWYVEPAKGENAAEFYLRAFNTMKVSSFKLLPATAKMPSFTKSSLQGIVASNRDALQLLREGTRHEQSRYALDLTQGFETLLPHLGKLREATKIALYSATLHAEDQKGKEAAEDVLAALGLGRSLQAEPLLLSQFIRAASLASALAALEQTLNRTTLSAEALSALAKVFQQMEANEARGDAFNRAMTGERATALSILNAPHVFLAKLTGPGGSNMMKADEREKWIACLQNTGNLKAELQYYETTFEKLMAARTEPFPARLRTGEFISRRTAEAKTTGMVMNDLLMPGRVGTAAKEGECLAHLRLGLAASALEQFRAAHGKHYPAALSELPAQHSPDALMDPFDGQPLRYEQKGAGYLLYSIGPNLTDDAGERTHGKDLVFEVGGFADAK